MANNKNILKEKKQTMLAELESIKSLLDDELDNIPVLQETVGEQSSRPTADPIPNLTERALDEDRKTRVKPTTEAKASSREEPETQTTTHKTEGVLPGQQSLFSEKNKRQQKSQANDPQAKAKTSSEYHFDDNPFLPQHIRQRLNGASGVTDDHIPTLPNTTPNENINTEQIIDQLIARYMPKIEAELRRKLFKAMTQPTDDQKK